MNDEVGADTRSVKYISASSGFSNYSVNHQLEAILSAHLILLSFKDYLGLLWCCIEPFPWPVLDLQQCLSNFEWHSQSSREVLGRKQLYGSVRS